jgi:hypothetical protein
LKQTCQVFDSLIPKSHCIPVPVPVIVFRRKFPYFFTCHVDCIPKRRRVSRGPGRRRPELAGVSNNDVAVAEQATEAGCVLQWALKSRQSSRRLAVHFIDLIETPRLDASRCGPTRHLALSFVGAQLIAVSLRRTQP